MDVRKYHGAWSDVTRMWGDQLEGYLAGPGMIAHGHAMHVAPRKGWAALIDIFYRRLLIHSNTTGGSFTSLTLKGSKFVLPGKENG